MKLVLCAVWAPLCLIQPDRPRAGGPRVDTLMYPEIRGQPHACAVRGGLPHIQWSAPRNNQASSPGHPRGTGEET